ncbi:type IV secretory system conjugative DNA transfer family protein [Stenoxybacter acetivorans]|uniref:type IV secretory system conjugative DNA transfer family protein n=1 Tax=Stenoxybacter acetivorans TaxID=422441 RepID=UPI00055B8D31|nr:type IV secretory system conjugative DNA transfer family protein [Stenoxybacter acetivorans]
MNQNPPKRLPILLFGLITALIFAVAGQYLCSWLFIDQVAAKARPSLMLLFRYFNARNQLPNSWTVPFYLYFGLSIFAPIVPLLMVLILAFAKEKRELHGSARFANRSEIFRSGLLLNDEKLKQNLKRNIKMYPDLLIGKVGKDFLRWSSNTFLYIAAPTRSGKGVGVVIPNCLHYRGSMVVYDPKLENFLITGGFRERELKQKVFLFNPSGVMPENATDSNAPLRSHRWNPLTYVRRQAEYTYKDALSIANILVPKSEKGGSSKFFDESAQKLFTGLVLYLVETEKERFDADPDRQNPRTLTTLSNLFRMTAPSNGMPLAKWLQEDLAVREANPALIQLSDQCKTLLYGFANSNEKSGADVLATLTAGLGIFLDPVVEAAISGDDFDLREVRTQKMTVFLGLNPTDTQVFANLTNLFFSQLIDQNIKQGLPEDYPPAKHQCLLLMDEFTALGVVPAIKHGVGYIAGYGLRLFIIIQTQSQVTELYGKEGAQTFWSNFEAQVIYPPNTTQEAEEYSKLLGYETYKALSKSRSMGKSGSRSKSESDQKRALMMPQELKIMPKTDCLVSLSSMRTIYAKKIRYYEEPIFQARANLPRVAIPVLHVHVGNRQSVPKPQTEAELNQTAPLVETVNGEDAGLKLLNSLMLKNNKPQPQLTENLATHLDQDAADPYYLPLLHQLQAKK